MNTGFYLFFINLSKIFFIFLNMVFTKLTNLGLFDFLKKQDFSTFLLRFAFKAFNLS